MGRYMDILLFLTYSMLRWNPLLLHWFPCNVTLLFIGDLNQFHSDLFLTSFKMNGISLMRHWHLSSWSFEIGIEFTKLIGVWVDFIRLKVISMNQSHYDLFLTSFKMNGISLMRHWHLSSWSFEIVIEFNQLIEVWVDFVKLKWTSFWHLLSKLSLDFDGSSSNST